jgi:hypothetical protein
LVGRIHGLELFGPTFDVMSPRHCGKKEMNLKCFWAVDIHDLFCLCFQLLVAQLS